MASDATELPKVRLSRLKFSNWETQEEEEEDGNPGVGSQPTTMANVVAGVQTINPQLYDLRRPEAYERMDADKPGEELARDATIWKLYLEEADDYDQELVKSRHASLDMLLLFAALFSAILTAFLIESKNLLQQDPMDTSNALLLSIAQSQQRIELGLPPPETGSPIDLPAFSPPRFARLINGIWFSSLALSLSAALVAMLGKEWLNAYLASRPRPAHAHVMLRQSRIEGLEQWWALHILALLPSLLHLSLLLFSIGLVIYLWTLDVAIAAVIASVIGLTVLFYATTAILGAFYEFCPYVTQISGYIKAIRETYRDTSNKDRDANSAYTSSSDLNALLWLAQNARDPAVVDCSYQALAGLKIRTEYTQSTLAATPGNQSKPSSPGFQDTFLQSDRGASLNSLLAVVCERFKMLMRNSDEMSASSWANAARYAKSLTVLASNMQKQGLGGSLDPKIVTDTTLPGTDPLAVSLIMELLNSSENVWSENTPSLHADVYASFITNELILLSLALPNNSQSLPSTQSSSIIPPLSRQDFRNQDNHVIDVAHDDPVRDGGSRLLQIRAQYSRSIFRAATLVRLHALRKITIGTVLLNRLLDAMSLASRCPALNPLDGYSTHHPQPSATSYALAVPYGPNLLFTTTASDLNTGPIGILMLLLRMSPEDQDLALQTRIAAAQTLSTLAPVILQQVIGMDREKLLQEFDYSTWTEGAPLDIKTIRFIAARQALLILRIVGHRDKLTDHKSHMILCRNALHLISNLLTESSLRTTGAALAIAHHGTDIVPLLESVAVSDSAFTLLTPVDCSRLVDISRLGLGNGSGENKYWDLCTTSLPPICFPPLIRMLKSGGPGIKFSRELLESVLRRIRNGPDDSPISTKVTKDGTPGIRYLHCFTRTADGFFALAQAGIKRPRSEWLIDTVIQITRIAAGRDPKLTYNVDPIELHTSAVPGFFSIVILVGKYCLQDPERNSMLLEFALDAADLVDVALKDQESQRLIKKNKVYTAVCTVLGTLKANKTSNLPVLERANLVKKGLRVAVAKLEKDPKQDQSAPSSDDDTQQGDDESESKSAVVETESNAESDDSDSWVTEESSEE